MAARGLGHHIGGAHEGGDLAGGHHGGHAGHAGHGGGHGGHGGHGHGGQHGGAASHGSHGHASGSKLDGKLLSLLSPRVIFSFLVGLGATGLLAGSVLSGPLLAGAALAGGILFERFIVTPIWNFLFRFESRAGLTLESAVFDEARAVTDFDRQGQGLIAVDLDGQVVQLLGTLTADDRSMGVRVRTGGRVRIEEVDSVRNRCVVSYLGE
ncbi:MAG: hypothetical protein ABI647_24730, partial [Gemmatimonadota bacterium]